MNSHARNEIRSYVDIRLHILYHWSHSESVTSIKCAVIPPYALGNISVSVISSSKDSIWFHIRMSVSSGTFHVGQVRGVGSD
jgi:hypothetical protein